MARIDYCDTSKSNERTREILGKNHNANIFRMMAHSPKYFEQYCRLGGALGRLLHHDVEISRNLRHRHATGNGTGLTGWLFSRPIKVCVICSSPRLAGGSK